MEIKALIKQIFVYSPGVLIPALMQFFALIVFTRLVDPDAYGRYALVVSTAHLIDAFGLAWIRTGQLRFYEAEKQKNKLDQLLATMSLTFVMTAACFVPICVILILVLPLDPAFSAALLAGVGYMILRAAVLQNLFRYRAAGHAKRYSAVEVSRSLLGFAAAVILVLLVDNKEIGLVLGVSLGYALVWTADLRAYVKMLTPKYFNKSKLREIFRYFRPIIIQMSLIQLMNVLDRYMIGLFLGPEKVGLYSVGFTVSQHSIGLIFTAILIPAYPLLLKEFEINGIEWARTRIKLNASIVLAICIPATAGLAVTSEYVAVVMLGQKYQSAAAVIIPWIALSTFVTGIRMHVYAHVFHLFKRVDLTLKIMALVVGTNFVLNALLIPRLGITGAIVATVVADAVGLALYIVVGRRLMPLDFPLRDAWRILLATAIMTASLASVEFPKSAVGLAAMVALGALVYAISALILDVLGARTHLLAWVRKFRR